MAEEVRAIQNKKLLFVSILLAVLVVIIYNVHVYQIIAGQTRDLVRLCKAARDLRRGDKVTRQDIVIEVVPKQYTEALGKVIQAKDMEFLTGRKEGLNKPVKQGEWFQFADLTGSGEEDQIKDMRPGMVGLTVQINPAESPGDILRPGHRVNIVGRLEVGNQPLQAYRILEAVRVLAVAGIGAQEETGKRGPGAVVQRGPRSYRSVTIEVHGSVSPALKNVLSFVQGDIWLEVCHPEAKPEGNKQYSEINPQLAALAKQTRVVER